MRTGIRVLGAVALAVGAVAVVLAAVVGEVSSVIASAAYLAFPVVGLVIARRHPRNAVAWVYVVAALLLGIEVAGQHLTTLGARHGWPDPAVHAAAWAQSWSWFPGLFLLVTVALLRFPDGRLPGRGWRWVEWGSYGGMAVWSLGIGTATLFVPTRVLMSDATPDPGGVAGTAFLVGEAMFGVVGTCAVLSLASLVVRYRRSGLVAREQLKWVMTAAAVAIAVEAALDGYGTVVGGEPDWVQSLGEGLGFGVIAVSVGVAITRYKLYEIDRIVSRTVAYAVVLVVLAAVYLGLLLGLATVLPTGVGQLGVAAATLAVAALAVPLTRRVRRLVDRRFNRSRFDAHRVVTEFATRLRARPDREDIPTDLVDVLRRTVQPSHASVWVRGATTRAQ